MKVGTKLDSNELYCVTKTATYCISVPLFVHFSFSLMKMSVADFSAPIGASVFNFYKHIYHIWTFFVGVFSATT